MTILHCYIPTSQYYKDDKEALYVNTSKLTNNRKQDTVIIYIDFNANVTAGNKTAVNGI